MTPQERLAYLLTDVWQPSNRGVILRDIYAAAGEHDSLIAETLYRVKNPVLVAVPNEDQGQEAIDAANAHNNQAMVLAEKVSQSCIAMSTKNGLILSDAKSQMLIDILADLGQWPDEVRDAVKALGGVWRKQWQLEGMETEPTLESVEQMIAAEELAEDQKQARETIAEAVRQADAVRFAAEQEGKSGAECIADWLAKITEDLS